MPTANAGVGRESAATPFDPGDIDIEARGRPGHMQGRRGLRMFQERGRQLAQMRKGGDEARIADRADLDRHKVPGAARLEADDDAALAATGVQGEAPAAGRGRGESRREIRLDAFPAKGLSDLLGLPGEIGFMPPVLHGAAPARAKMRARRNDPVGARHKHLDKLGSTALARGADALTWEGQGDEDRTGRQAVALGADLRDLELF